MKEGLLIISASTLKNFMENYDDSEIIKALDVFIDYVNDGTDTRESLPKGSVRAMSYEFINTYDKIKKANKNEYNAGYMRGKRELTNSTKVNIDTQELTNPTKVNVNDSSTYKYKYEYENKYKNKNEYEIDKESIVAEATTPQQKTHRFVKPSVEDIKAYCEERHNNLDAQHIYDHYESNGWKVGSNPMKDWKAAVRTWEKREYTKQQQAPKNALATNGEERIAIINGEKVNYNSFDPDEFFNLACKRDF